MDLAKHVGRLVLEFWETLMKLVIMFAEWYMSALRSFSWRSSVQTALHGESAIMSPRVCCEVTILYRHALAGILFLSKCDEWHCPCCWYTASSVKRYVRFHICSCCIVAQIIINVVHGQWSVVSNEIYTDYINRTKATDLVSKHFDKKIIKKYFTTSKQILMDLRQNNGENCYN